MKENKVQNAILWIALLLMLICIFTGNASAQSFKKIGQWVMYAGLNDSTHGIDSFVMFEPIHDTIRTTVIRRDTITITYPAVHDTIIRTVTIHDTVYQTSPVNPPPVEPPAGDPISIFSTQMPSGASENDGDAVELGMKFRSSTAGTVTGIRFYKTPGNTGTHIGELYDAKGNRLASAAFTGETASGWQTVIFSKPVKIAANTTYVAAYFAPAGHYPANIMNGLNRAITNGPLTALADGTDGGNGVYRYSATPTFPSSSYLKSNYWVDVIFASDEKN